MPKYLIEVSQPSIVSAKRVKDAICALGSHFAARARWQQGNGVATGTLVIEADDRQWALLVVPPNMRSSAKIIQLEVPSMYVAPAASVLDPSLAA